jgi:hypothetical protein
MIPKACNQMSIVRSTNLHSLLVVCGLAFLGLWCPKAQAADREISMHRFSFLPSALETRPAALSFPTPGLGDLGQLTRVVDSKRNVAAFLAPWMVRPAQLGNWVTEIMNKTETWLSNRTHMIQFCAIGMVIALVIIWWRKT